MKTPLHFAKIIATPTLQTWTQAYNAGNLIAILSVAEPASVEKDIQEISLPGIGKDIINSLEAEYFTLETKNLTSIKQAITSTVEKVPSALLVSFGVAVIIENILYLYLYGPGKIIMKRKEKIGVLLEQTEEKNLIAGSGYIENGDIIVLQTKQFSQTISLDVLSPFLSTEKLPEMAETFSAQIHEKQIGGAGAIVFAYSEEQHGSSVPEEKPVEQKPAEPLVPQKEDVHKQPEQNISDTSKPKKKFFPVIHFSHTKKLILTIVSILIVVLGTSIFFSTQKKEHVADQQLYQKTVIPAQKKYEEATSLLDLNKNLALDDFQNAKNILSPALGKFPPDSKEMKETTALMKKIDTALSQLSQTAASDAKQVDSGTNALLAALSQHTDAKYITEDTKTMYFANNKELTAITKNDSQSKTLITNENAWKDIGGLGTYLGNFYILDKTDGIHKFVPAGSKYTQSSYFPGTSPDLSKANALAIDGSIWIVFADGTINKYTRGKQDTFTIKGLDKPLVNPSRIYTTVDMDTLYILDNGNKRVVALDKKGNFLKQYPAGIIGQAQDFAVVADQKKIYILSTGKVWEMEMK